MQHIIIIESGITQISIRIEFLNQAKTARMWLKIDPLNSVGKLIEKDLNYKNHTFLTLPLFKNLDIQTTNSRHSTPNLIRNQLLQITHKSTTSTIDPSTISLENIKQQLHLKLLKCWQQRVEESKHIFPKIYGQNKSECFEVHTDKSRLFLLNLIACPKHLLSSIFQWIKLQRLFLCTTS